MYWMSHWIANVQYYVTWFLIQNILIFQLNSEIIQEDLNNRVSPTICVVTCVPPWKAPLACPQTTNPAPLNLFTSTLKPSHQLDIRLSSPLIHQVVYLILNQPLPPNPNRILPSTQPSNPHIGCMPFWLSMSSNTLSSITVIFRLSLPRNQQRHSSD